MTPSIYMLALSRGAEAHDTSAFPAFLPDHAILPADLKLGAQEMPGQRGVRGEDGGGGWGCLGFLGSSLGSSQSCFFISKRVWN